MPAPDHNSPINQPLAAGHPSNRGSVLVAIIITMVVVAGLGASLVTMTSTSAISQFGAMDSLRAYYLAEAGGRYAIPIIKANLADPATLIAQLDGMTYSLANGDRFRLSLAYAAPYYTLISTGLLRQGEEVLRATRRINYRILNLPSGNDNPFDTPADLADNWTGYDPKRVEVVDNKQSDDSPALNLAGKEVTLLLDWDNNPNLPNLADSWSAADGLLSYEIQIKIKVNKTVTPEYMLGLSFRLRPDASYGFSFLKRDNCKRALPSANFCSQIPGKDNDLYIVLWKNIGGNYTVLDYRRATVDDNVLDNDELRDWSTLIVKIVEQYVLDGDGNRQDLNGDGYLDRTNLISGYIQGTAIYPRGTIAWDYSLFRPVGWISGATNPIYDGFLTSENFDLLRPNEIGLHAYFPDAGKNQQFMDDFSLQLITDAASGGDIIVQY